jgi:RNA polymerase sigma factor (sigma-70 family)
MDDHELLREYAQARSQSAFGELVGRHLAMVYSAACRMVGDAHLAEDVAQGVFAVLARKAATLDASQAVGGWLYNTTRHLATRTNRAERRRREREQAAAAMHCLETPDDPNRILEHLEPALAELEEADRDALVLRYFEDRSLREMGRDLAISEDAARMRVNRALERLRTVFARQGITVSSALLATVLAASTSTAIPAGLAAAVTAAAASAATQTVLMTMTWLNAKSAAAIILAAALAGTGTYLLQQRQTDRLRAENLDLQGQSQNLAQLQRENERLSNLAANAGQPAPSKEQFAELLRLRGEVGLLRADMRNALAAGRPAGASQNQTGANTEAAAAAEPFTATLTARVGDGQTFLTGGWSTAPGKRTFLVMTPAIDPADGVTVGPDSVAIPKAKVTINFATIELPEAMLAQLGMDQLRADGRDSSVQTVLTAADAETLLTMLKDPPDGIAVTRGRMTTNDGISASMSVVPSPSLDGQPAMPIYSIGLTPNLTADQTAVNMSINARVAPPSASSPGN